MGSWYHSRLDGHGNKYIWNIYETAYTHGSTGKVVMTPSLQYKHTHIHIHIFSHNRTSINSMARCIKEPIRHLNERARSHIHKRAANYKKKHETSFTNKKHRFHFSCTHFTRFSLPFFTFFLCPSYYCIRFSIVHFLTLLAEMWFFFSVCSCVAVALLCSSKLHHIRGINAGYNERAREQERERKNTVKIKINLQKVESFGVHFHFSIFIHSPNILYDFFYRFWRAWFWPKHHFNKLHTWGSERRGSTKKTTATNEQWTIKKICIQTSINWIIQSFCIQMPAIGNDFYDCHILKMDRYQTINIFNENIFIKTRYSSVRHTIESNWCDQLIWAILISLEQLFRILEIFGLNSRT